MSQEQSQPDKQQQFQADLEAGRTPQPAPPVSPADQTAPADGPQADAEKQSSPNVVEGGEGTGREPAVDEPDEKPAFAEGPGPGLQVLTDNPGHEPVTTFHHVNQETGNHERQLSVEDRDEVAGANAEPTVNHDDDGVVIPGHESDSEVGRAMAIQDARARAVATTPHLSDEQPGMPVIKAKTVQPVQLDGRNRRNDDDAILHSFVDVVDGDHKGRMGAFERVLEYGENGWPTKALVRTRDEFNELLAVAYDHLRPSRARGGR